MDNSIFPKTLGEWVAMTACFALVALLAVIVAAPWRAYEAIMGALSCVGGLTTAQTVV